MAWEFYIATNNSGYEYKFHRETDVLWYRYAPGDEWLPSVSKANDVDRAHLMHKSIRLVRLVEDLPEGF